MSRITLGLNAYHADAAAALFRDGELCFAIEEERLNRRKHCGGFPSLAVQTCLKLAGLPAEEIEHVAVSRDGQAQLARKALFAAERALQSLASPSAERAALLSALGQRWDNRRRLGRIRDDLERALGQRLPLATIHAVEHHRAHLASAFFASEFDQAAVLSLDGFGDFTSTMWGTGQANQLAVQHSVGFPHSLGLLYTAVSQWLGFDRYGDEGKVMGLSACGRPTLLPRLRQLVRLTSDGGFMLNLRYFRHHRQGVDMTFGDETPQLGRLYSPALCDLLGCPRAPGPGVETQPYFCDVAASLQALLTESVVHICRHLQRRTGLAALCLAGGVALNCVANAAILEQTDFRELFVQPAAGDNGTALGAALWVEHQVLQQPRRFVMRHAYTGPTYDAAACGQALAAFQAGSPLRLRITRIDADDERCARAAAAIADGAVLGWFAGAMEFGPRALGHRSILCDPRRADMKDLLNRRIKHREPFRPFAPAVLLERVGDWFERGTPSPAMLLVDRVRSERRAQVPAITHHDGTGRLQTVSVDTSPLFHRLLGAFEQRTGVPILLNTSFNEHEPIVCTPLDALRCFEKTRMDVLVLGSYYIEPDSRPDGVGQGAAPLATG
jgi:carbamoyltransferase